MVGPKSPKSLTGPQIIDEMAAKPNADRFFQSNPASFTDAELMEFIENLRQQRVLLESKK